jgi:hypothetical protein
MSEQGSPWWLIILLLVIIPTFLNYFTNLTTPFVRLQLGLNPTSLLLGAISTVEPVRLKGNEQFPFI